MRVLKLDERHTPVIAGSTAASSGGPSIADARILVATHPTEVIEALLFVGRRTIAHRIKCLDEMTTDGAPDEPPIMLVSLRELALFLLSEPQLAAPEIAVGPTGLLLAEWASPEHDVLAMEFRPDGIIQFAAVSAGGTACARLRVHGELPKDLALNAVRDFIPSSDSVVA